MSFVFIAKRMRQRLAALLRFPSGQILFHRLSQVLVLLLVVLLLLSNSSCRRVEKVTRKTDVPSPNESKASKQAEVKKPEEQKTTGITLYFADSNAEYLVPEIREVSGDKPLEAAVQELIKGPKNEELASCLPKGTQLRGIRVEDGIAYVDFSQELISRYPGGSAAETMTIYSVANTLAEFPQIKKVKFLVEGEPISALSGHYDMSQAFEPRLDLVKQDNE